MKADSQPGARGDFPSTQWSIVVAAGHNSTPDAQQALATLCERYWYPLYAYVRRRGYDANDAGELTQDFFATLLEKNYLQAADRERGKFRAFLLAAMKHFLANQQDRAHAQKRGGGQLIFSLNLENAENSYKFEPSHELTPEKIYERRWALTLLDRVLKQLQDEYQASNQVARFDCLKGFLTGESSLANYRAAAAVLNITEATVKVAVHRLRQRYGEILRSEIGQTISDPEDLAAEIKGLFTALQ